MVPVPVASPCGGLLAACHCGRAGGRVAWPRAGPRRQEDRRRSRAFTEYRLDNGLQVLVCPDVSKPTVTVNLTVFVGSRHEGYGETGMAHLLEHMLFKGTPTHTHIPKELQERGARVQRHHLGRPDQLLRDDAGHGRESGVRHGAGSRPADQQQRQPRRPDLGDDGRPQRVRARREHARRAALPAAAGRGLRVAQLRQVDDRQPHRHRTRADRAAQGRFTTSSTSPTTPCWWSPASSTKTKALELIDKYFGPIPKPNRKLDRTYTEEPPQDGERSVMLRRVGDLGLVGAVYHIPSGAHPGHGCARHSGRSARQCSVGPALQVARRNEQGHQRSRSTPAVGTIRACSSCLPKSAGRFAGRGARNRCWKGPKQSATKRSPPRKSSAPGEDSEAARTDGRRHRDAGGRAEQLGLARAIGGCTSCIATGSKKSRPKTSARVAAKYLIRSNRTNGRFIPTEHPERVTVPAAPTGRAVRRIPRPRGSTSRRSLRHLARQYRRPQQGDQARQRHQGSAAAEKNARAKPFTCGSTCATATRKT